MANIDIIDNINSYENVIAEQLEFFLKSSFILFILIYII